MFKWARWLATAAVGIGVGLNPTVGKSQETEVVFAIPALTLTFTAHFGHGSPEAEHWPPTAEQSALRSALPGQILLVEDHPVNQEVAIRLLEAWGHSVITAESGPGALAALADRHVDLVLMDVQMLGMDGLQVTAEIRRREQGRGSRTPIVASSTNRSRPCK